MAMPARFAAAEVRPGAVIGFGGYPRFRPLHRRAAARIPTAMHEQNAVLGRANRMLATASPVASRLSFEPTKHLAPGVEAKARLTGIPVRDPVIAFASGLPGAGRIGGLLLLVFGGSQGARFFSDIAAAGTALSAGARAV